MMTLKNKICKGAAAIAFAVASAGIGAAQTDLNTLPIGATTFGGSSAPGFFNDIFTFNVPANSGTGVSVSNIPVTLQVGTLGLGFTSISIWKDTDNVLFVGDTLVYSNGSGGNSLTIAPQNLAPLQSGRYYLAVSGVANGSLGGVYSGAFSVAAPVPEPESYAMLLAGLGLVGAMVVKRRKL
jgi:hypothetical protein